MPYCCLCEQTVSAWLPYPLIHQRSEFMKLMQTVGSDLSVYQCPSCGCNDRDRHLWLYLNQIGVLQQLAGASVLHIAPELALESRFASMGLQLYVRGDLMPSRPGMVQVDVENIDFPDQHFDLIICNHVLEHVRTPSRALAELHRCLKPQGVLIAQTPYSPILMHTFEVTQAMDADFARLFYGQEDHVRLFGRDIAHYFHEAGLRGELLDHQTLLPDMDPAQYGCNAREPLFFFSRP